MLKTNLIQKETVIVQRISLSSKDYVKKKIDALNKKANKFGTKPMELSFGSAEMVYKYKGKILNQAEFDALSSPDGARKYNTCMVKLSYEIPKIDGWELICTFDIVPIGMDDDGKPIMEVFTSKVPNKIIPVEWQKIKEIKCDHCGHNRFRNHSMLMHHIEDDVYKEVGSTCIKDFFGHDPKMFMTFARFTFPIPSDDLGSEIEDGMDYRMGGQGYRMGCDDLKTLLAMTSACIKKWGWVSASYAYDHGGSSTKDFVIDQLNPPKGWETLAGFEKIYPNEDDIEISLLKNY